MAMKFCPKCGAPLLEGARFCSKCRAPIDQSWQPNASGVEMSGSCQSCGAMLIKGAAFCSKCRAPVASPPHQTAQPLPVPGNLAGTARSAAQTAVSRFGGSLPMTGGELSFNVPAPAAALTGGGASPVRVILSILSGLGAGGASCAALWNTEHPMIISGCIAAVILLIRMIVWLIRRQG